MPQNDPPVAVALRDPVIVCMDEPFPETWVPGDKLIMQIHETLHILTVKQTNHGVHGPNFLGSTRFGAEEIAAHEAYQARLKKRETLAAPLDIDHIWNVTVAVSKP